MPSNAEEIALLKSRVLEIETLLKTHNIVKQEIVKETELVFHPNKLHDWKDE